MKVKNTVEKSLVRHWTFDEEDVSIVTDYSSVKSHGQVKGNPKRGIGMVGKSCLELNGEEIHYRKYNY